MIYMMIYDTYTERERERQTYINCYNSTNIKFVGFQILQFLFTLFQVGSRKPNLSKFSRASLFVFFKVFFQSMSPK